MRYVYVVFIYLGFTTCRMLRSLLSAPGVNPEMVTIFIDGYFEVSLSFVLNGEFSKHL